MREAAPDRGNGKTIKAAGLREQITMHNLAVEPCLDLGIKGTPVLERAADMPGTILLPF